MRHLRALARAGLRFWQMPWHERVDVLVAFIELARARWRLHRTPASQMVAMHGPAAPPATLPQPAIALRVGLAINRASKYVPWRSDCLVQALAAQAWLKRNGVATSLRIGVRKSTESDRPYTHAWLLCGGSVVTGGDISAFHPFVPVPNGAAAGSAEIKPVSDLA